MTLLTITDAARAAGVSRRTIQHSIQSGRLSAATTATGERAIDTAELLRVFGPMRQAPSDTPASMSRPVATNDAPDTATATLIEVLREQLQQAQQEKARLLSLLESEQEARRNLEQKLLLPPPRHTRPVVLLIVLALTLVALVITRGAAGAVGNARNAMEGKASGATGLSRGRCGSPLGAARPARMRVGGPAGRVGAGPTAESGAARAGTLRWTGVDARSARCPHERPVGPRRAGRGQPLAGARGFPWPRQPLGRSVEIHRAPLRTVALTATAP